MSTSGNLKTSEENKSSVRYLLFAVIAFAFLSIAALVYFSYFSDEEKKISYKGLYGDAFVNGVRFDEILLSPGDRIVTKTDSSSEIEIEKMFFINLYPDTEMEIENSYYSKKKKLNIFNFRLNSGTIYVKFEKTQDIAYRFITKDAKIESGGTEFLIEIAKDGTTVVVTEGTLNITLLKTGEIKIAEKDRVYNIREKIEVSEVEKPVDVDLKDEK